MIGFTVLFMNSHMPRVTGAILSTSCLLALMTGVGCTERPSDHIGAAERLVTEARQGQASVYATEDVQRLERLLLTLQATVEEQDDYPRFMRDYGHADTLAVRIARDAQNVIDRSSTEHDQAHHEASVAVDEAEAVLAQTRQRIRDVTKQDGVGGMRRLAVDSEALVVSMSRAKDALDAEDYLAATARARAITAQGRSLTDQVDAIAMQVGDSQEPRLTQP